MTKQDTYTTQMGIELTIQAVPRSRIDEITAKAKLDFEEQHGAVKPPTYTTSVDEVFEHDEESIKDDLTTDEERAEWLAYTKKRERLLGYMLERAALAWIYIGVLDPVPEDTAWFAPWKALGLALPDDPVELKLYWLETVALADKQEKFKLAAAIKALGDPVEVEAAQAAETFRHPLARREKTSGASAEKGAVVPE